MDEMATYNIELSGEIREGFDLEQAQSSFSSLFKVSPEKARKIVGSKRVLKKGLSQESAQNYKNRLENIGIAVIMKEQQPEPPVLSVAAPALSLEPQSEPQVEVIPQEDQPQPSLDSMSLEPIQEAAKPFEEGESATAQTAPMNTEAEEDDDEEEEEDVIVEGDAFSLKSLVAVSIAAMAGAFLWQFIAVTFEYEIGLIAWLIGGGIGFAAVITKARGQAAGVICGVLAMLAIIGGKYLATSSFQADWVDSLAALTDAQKQELMEVFEQEQYLAEEYAEDVFNDSTMRQFMVEYEYTDSIDATNISFEEVEHFRKFSEPSLKFIKTNNPTYEQWMEHNLKASLEDISTVDVMLESLGVIDFVFLFLGVGTAFRLGRGL